MVCKVGSGFYVNCGKGCFCLYMYYGYDEYYNLIVKVFGVV